MELKYLHVNEKEYTESLLLSPKQVLLLKELLKELIKNEVLVINTNLGVEIYYQSSDDCTTIIKNVMSLVVSDCRDAHVCFETLSLQNEKEIQCTIDLSMIRVINDPLFLTYLKNMLNQVKSQQKSNKEIIKKLTRIWNETMSFLRRNKVDMVEIEALHNDFQQVYIDNINDKVLKELVTGVVHAKYVN